MTSIINIAHGFDNDLVLRGGVNLSYFQIEANDSSKDGRAGYGFNTQFAYHWDKWELSLASHIFFSKVEELSFEIGSDQITGNGSYRNVSITPLIKYYTSYSPKTDWFLYFGIGPSFSIQTYKLTTYQSTSQTINNNSKLTYESIGAAIVIGIEEETLFKEMHPVYIELLYSNRRSYKASILDSSDFTEVKLVEDEEDDDIKTHTLIIQMGISLF